VGKDAVPRTGLFALQPVDRLAIEMAAHEEQERRALDGEPAPLEQAWRAAEELAAIADDLLLPDTIHRRIDERQATGTSSARAGAPSSPARRSGGAISS
jgi:hypothetical protein